MNQVEREDFDYFRLSFLSFDNLGGRSVLFCQRFAAVRGGFTLDPSAMTPPPFAAIGFIL
jgi:hypothetical protein